MLGFAITIVIIILAIWGYDAIRMGRFENFNGIRLKKSNKTSSEVSTKVKTEILGEEGLHESLTFQGLVIPKEVTPIYIDTPTVIEAILVNDGEIVSKGTKLFEFNEITEEDLNRELEVINLDLQNKRLQLSDIRSGSITLELNERELEMESLRENINSLNREIEISKFEARTLREKAEIMKKLLKNSGISTTEANEAITMAERKENELTNLRTSLTLARQKYDLSLLSYQKLRRELLLNQNFVNGEHRKLLLEKANINRKLSEIDSSSKAPVDGIVIDIAAKEGDSIPKGSRLLSIASGKDFLVRLEVPLQQSKRIEVGQRAKILTDRYFDGRDYTGVVSRIANVAKSRDNKGQQNRFIEVEILIEDAQGMKPGFLAEVKLRISSKEKSKTINSFSLFEEEGKSFVYVVKENIAYKTPVDIGLKFPTKYEVLNLDVGTEIIVNPFKVKDGQKVEVIE